MQLEEVIFRPTGAFLVTGPTGSGKSTTIYAALCDVLRPEINVITIEDPVEYRLPDVYQLAGEQARRADVRHWACARSCGATPTC